MSEFQRDTFTFKRERFVRYELGLNLIVRAMFFSGLYTVNYSYRIYWSQNFSIDTSVV